MKAPKGFGPEQREHYLAHIRGGMMRGAAAEAVGLKRIDVLEWIGATPAFERLVQDAERERLEHVQEALWNAALSGSVPAARAVLEAEGVQLPEHRGRPRNPEPERPADQFEDLDRGVVSLESRRKK